MVLNAHCQTIAPGDQAASLRRPTLWQYPFHVAKTLISSLILVTALSACAEEDIIVCPAGYKYNPVSNTCKVDLADSGQAMDNTGSDSTGEAPDAGSGPEDIAIMDVGPEDTGPVAAEDAGAQDIRIDGVCDPLIDPMNLRIGMPCTSHTQCGTCYCYDEAYMAPFRFCTKNCSSGSGSACSDNNTKPDEYKCLKFTAKQVNDYDLNVGGICQASCQSVDDCKIYGPDYNFCPATGGTQWEGSTVQAANTCQVQ
jgi:hypothetical protein